MSKCMPGDLFCVAARKRYYCYMADKKTISLLLRIGVAFAFIYPAVAGFFDPYSWVGFFPPFLLQIIPGTILLPAFGIFEIILALLILFMKRPFYPSIIASAVLLAIIVLDFKAIDIIFRDVSILLMTVTLALLNKERPEGYN